MKLFFLLTAFIASALGAFAQGTAFTYQGRLYDNGGSANGSYDVRFALYDAATSGTQQGVARTNTATGVTNGIFTVTLDFGNQFPGTARWVEVAVRTNGAGAFTSLAPRQPLTAAPYAITASNLTGNLPATQVSGALANANLPSSPTVSGTVTAGNFAGNGASVTNVNAAALNGLNASNFWKIGGNSGTTAGIYFIGTTDNQPLELKVSGQRVFRIGTNGDSYDGDSNFDGAFNMIGGSPGNFVGTDVVGVTISGGGATNYFGFTETNFALADYSTVSGGLGNSVGLFSFWSTIGGGYDNNIADDSEAATIAGGRRNDIGINSDYGSIGGGFNNNIATDSIYGTIAGGVQNDIRTGSYYATMGGGYNNSIGDNVWYATVVGGSVNNIGIYSSSSTIGGGYENTIAAHSVGNTVAGGYLNNIGTNSEYSAIGGGSENKSTDNSDFATIPGGQQNSATNYAFAAGRRAKAGHTGAFVWGDSTDADIASTTNNSVTIRASGGYRFFTGTAGAQLAAGATAWSVLSDRNQKKDFAAINPVDILEKLSALPITQWRYNWEAAQTTPHIGPMAQDFKHAFYPGADDTTISTLETDGVALAAIQGLHQKLKQKDAELAELKGRLEKLERLLTSEPATK